MSIQQIVQYFSQGMNPECSDFVQYILHFIWKVLHFIQYSSKFFQLILSKLINNPLRK